MAILQDTAGEDLKDTASSALYDTESEEAMLLLVPPNKFGNTLTMCSGKQNA